MGCKGIRVSLVIMLMNFLSSSRISSGAYHNYTTTVNVAWLVSEEMFHDVSKASSIGALALAVIRASNITGNSYKWDLTDFSVFIWPIFAFYTWFAILNGSINGRLYIVTIKRLHCLMQYCFQSCFSRMHTVTSSI